MTRSDNAETISAYEWISFGKRKKKKYFPHTPKTKMVRIAFIYCVCLTITWTFKEQPSWNSVMRDVNGREIMITKTPTNISNGHNTVPAGNRHPQLVDCGFQSVKVCGFIFYVFLTSCCLL